jgi:hypothetical protein
MMMEELRHEYMREIQEKEDAIGQLKDRFRAHRSLVTNETTAEVSEIFKEKQDLLDKNRLRTEDFDMKPRGGVADQTNKKKQINWESYTSDINS